MDVFHDYFALLAAGESHKACDPLLRPCVHVFTGEGGAQAAATLTRLEDHLSRVPACFHALAAACAGWAP